MANRLRQWIESIVFAGLKPGAAQSGAGRMRWLGPLAGPLDRLLSGSRPTDPLYLSNQSTGQKVRRALLVALPLGALGGVVAVALSNRVPVQTKPQAEPTAAEIAARMLPNLAAEVKIEANKDVQVVEALIRQGPPPTVVGTARNNTDRKIAEAELVFDLTDAGGSQVGAVSTTLRDLAPKATVPFKFPIKQRDAAIVLVRETHAR